jgi:isopenicillin-N N-acyltransferase like protein
MRFLFVLSFSTGLIISIPAAAQAAEKSVKYPVGKKGNGEIRTVNGVPVMILAGTPEEMGRQQGQLVGKFIAPLLKYPRTFLKRNRMDAQWPLIVGVSNILLTRAQKSHQQELRSVIRSSGLDASSVSVANTMLELRRLGGCSTLIVGKQRSKTGGPLFGRNFDFPPMGVLDKYGIVTIYKPKGKHAFASVGYPGLLGVISGMNDAGLAVATLDVYACNDSSPMFNPLGTPMMFTYRRILEECTTVEQAEKMLRAAKHTTWMNLSVCDKNRSVVFELTPKSVVIRKPVGNLLSCTNHFRSPELCKSKVCRRFAALSKSATQKKLGIQELSKYLHDANQGKWTIQTMIFEPSTLRLHVSLNNPPTSARKMKIIELSKLFNPVAAKGKGKFFKKNFSKNR